MKMKQKGNTLSMSKGFTLVELVVVMAIIAVLVALALFAINAARQQSRNTSRRGNVQTLKTALEAFYSNANPKAYPVAAAGISGYTMMQPAGALRVPQDYLPGFVDNDPSGNNSRICYFNNGGGALATETGGSRYGLAAMHEPNAPVACTAAVFTVTATDITTTGNWENFSQR